MKNPNSNNYILIKGSLRPAFTKSSKDQIHSEISDNSSHNDLITKFSATLRWQLSSLAIDILYHNALEDPNYLVNAFKGIMEYLIGEIQCYPDGHILRDKLHEEIPRQFTLISRLTRGFSGSLVSQYLDYLPTIVQLATSASPHLIGLDLSKQKERLEVLYLLQR